MTDAYVNVVIDTGSVESAAAEIAAIDAVDVAHVVTGEPDIVAQLDLDDREALPGVVANDIHAVDGVADTTTNVAFPL